MLITHNSKDDFTPAQRDSPTKDPVRLAIGGQGFSGGRAYQQGRPEPSEVTEITDQGDEALLDNFMRRRTDSLGLSYNDSQGRLQGQLFGAITGNWTQFDSRGFIPTPQLLKMVTPMAVALELEKYEASRRRRLQKWKPQVNCLKEARTICGQLNEAESTPDAGNGLRKYSIVYPKTRSYRRIFAILLLIERSHRIRSFIDEGVSDADLALVVSRGAFKLEVRRKNDAPDSPPLQCFKKWRDSTICRFEKTQWTVLAPFFAPTRRTPAPHYRLQPKAILPFLSWEPVSSRGGFGQVYKAEIHRDHHSFPKPEVGLLSTLRPFSPCILTEC